MPFVSGDMIGERLGAVLAFGLGVTVLAAVFEVVKIPGGAVLGEFVIGNWMFLIGLLGLGVLTFWAADAYEEEQSLSGFVDEFGENAEEGLTESVGAVGTLVVVGTSIAVSLGNEMLMLASQLSGLIGDVPVVVGHVLFGILVFLNVGTFGLNQSQLGLAFIVITIVALLLRFGGDG